MKLLKNFILDEIIEKLNSSTKNIYDDNDTRFFSKRNCCDEKNIDYGKGRSMMRREFGYGKGNSMIRNEFDYGKGESSGKEGKFYYAKKC